LPRHIGLQDQQATATGLVVVLVALAVNVIGFLRHQEKAAPDAPLTAD
jgi:hypothetical protein